MARQNIGIGSIANDGTGDSLRAGGDKINDNFIELYSMFDDWPGDFDFIPLELVENITLDGNNFDLIFGSPNPLNDFQVYADNSIYFELGNTSMLFDAAFSGTVTLVSESIFIQATDGGSDLSKIDLDETSGINLETNIGFSLLVDDGVDSSNFNILPDSIDFATGDFGVTGFADFLLDVTSGIQIIYYDSSLDASSIVFGVGGEMNISGVTGTIGFDDLLIGGTLVGFDIPVKLKTYTVAGGLPDASIYQDALIVVTDESGGRTPAYSDGTNWRRLYDMNIVS